MKIDFLAAEQADAERLSSDRAGIRQERMGDISRAGAKNAGAVAGGFRLDLTGGKNDAAYGFQGNLLKSAGDKEKTLADVLEEGGNYDAATAHKYMAVMSNTMSGEDFRALQEEGYDPGKMDPVESVTNLDRIKVTLAKAGVHVAGYTDTVDQATAEAITGSVTAANAALDGQKAGENQADAGSTGSGADKRKGQPYQTMDRMEAPAGEGTSSAGYRTPSLDHSSKGADRAIQKDGVSDRAYSAKENGLSQAQLDRNEIIAALEDGDLPATEDNIRAVWTALEEAAHITPFQDSTISYLLQNGLDPTIQNVYEAQHISAGKGLLQGQGYFAADGGDYFAARADSGDLSGITDQIDDIINQAGLPVSEETRSGAAWLIRNGIPLNTDTLSGYEDLRNVEVPLVQKDLMPEIAEALSRGEKATDAYIIKGYREIKQARVLSETRLMMTAEANQALSEIGLESDMKALSEEVDLLKQKEAIYFRAAFGSGSAGAGEVQEKTELAQMTIARVSEIRTMPAALAGRFVSADSFTLNDVYEAGSASQARFQAASQTYEAVGTEVRRDLGDSIRKAFSNVDDILKEMDLEVNYDNQRAVRILGYNSMEINHQNLDRVRAADLRIRNLVDKMTPAVTVDLIRKNVNPLTMDVKELTELADSLSTETDKAEKFSEYLYKLERNGGISEEEATSYIGIYRLFRQIEKTDGAVIGSLVDAGKDLSLKNLLTELRTRKKGHMDMEIDLSFGGMTEKEETSRALRIDAQIETAFRGDYMRQAAREVFDRLDPDKLAGQDINENTSLTDLLDGLREEGPETEAARDYRTAQAEELREAAKTDEAVCQMLTRYETPVTPDNLSAAAMLLYSRGGMFKGIDAKADGDEKERLREKADDILDRMGEGDSESIKDSYGDLCDLATEILDKSLDSADKYLDVRELKSLHMQLTVARSFAREENYEVPMEIQGELTSINLKIIHGSGESGVSITMDSIAYGRVDAGFSIRGNVLGGTIATTDSDGETALRKRLSDITAAIEREGISTGLITVMQSRSLNINRVPDRGEESPENNGGSQTAVLYRAAKAFIREIA
ncbi:MAG: DUF6240 domain-containing protein [Lachnospiraceae bacterium]|nr:DUF6240 domain-containing protein [Lachnospiraceae bacterium]